MSYLDIIRAWKGKESQRGLSEKQPAVLPEDEARLTELADAELDAVQGAGSRVSGSVEWGVDLPSQK
jgi:mersacidin/lichenicidin family type 2 lantibiotic